MDQKQIFKDLFGKKGYKLDLRFMIDDGKQHPLAILVPGGGYSLVCSFVEGTPIARKLNEKGISAAIVYYSTMKKARCPKPIDDLACGVKEVLALKKRYHLDIEHYSLWGASAGGHLAGEFCSDNLGASNYDLPKPATLILSYPVVTMDRKYTHMGTHDNFLGKDASITDEEMASIEKHVGADFPRTFLWYGTADEEVDNQNSILLKEALIEKGIDNKCLVFEGVGHGVGNGLGTAAYGWIDEAVSFWLERK